jgi:hypothetical protein
MKSKIYLILSILANGLTIFSQQTDLSTRRYWEANSQLNAKTLKSTSNNGYVVAGNADIQFGQTNYVAGFVFYSDSTGSNHWEKAYSSFGNTFAFQTIAQLADSGFIAGGNMFNPITNQLGGALLKLDQQGNEIWKKSISDSSGADIVVSDLLVESDTSFLLVAKKTGESDGNYIIRMDSAGNILWQNSFEMPGNDKIELNSLKQSSDKSLFIVGTLISNSNQSGLLMRLDSLGNIVWAVKNNYPNSSFTDLLLDSNQLFCRNTTTFGEAILHAFDLNGNSLWNLKLPESEDNFGPFVLGKRKLIFDADSNIVVYSSNFSFSSFYRFSKEGNYIDGLYGFGSSQAIDFYPNGTCSILMSGPAFGVKSSLIMNNHFAITRLENFNSIQTSCLWGSQAQGAIFTDNTTTINLIPSTNCTVSTAMMENVSAFISIDNNCVEFLGSVGEINQLDFEVSPNPANNLIQLSINSNEALYNKGSLVNSLGKEVLSFSIYHSKQSIDVSAVQSGVYWLKIGNKSKKVIIL